jgi:hypothetical protein
MTQTALIFFIILCISQMKVIIVYGFKKKMQPCVFCVGNHTLLWTQKVTVKNVACNHQHQLESELMELGTGAIGSPF